MKIKQIVACAAVVAATGVSAPVFAGATGNVGAFSEYMFRGVEQSNGAAIQGGLDFSSASGLYAGTWISNTGFGSLPDGESVTYETDIYAGYATKVGDVGLDIGALYYYYTDANDLNTLEGYVGASYGPVAAKFFYTDDYFGTDEDGYYATASATFPVTSSVNFIVNGGYNGGKGVEAFLGDKYYDYGATVTKTLEAGFTFSLAAIGTDLDTDRTKLVLGLKKSFDL